MDVSPCKSWQALENEGAIMRKNVFWYLVSIEKRNIKTTQAMKASSNIFNVRSQLCIGLSDQITVTTVQGSANDTVQLLHQEKILRIDRRDAEGCRLVLKPAPNESWYSLHRNGAPSWYKFSS
jgi:hypothetical protein